jgi:hypothetical protein
MDLHMTGSISHTLGLSFILLPKPFSLQEQVPEDKLLKQILSGSGIPTSLESFHTNPCPGWGLPSLWKEV